ncbi:hypothetical protein L3Q82_013506 [Scortum barcoo]|uniref:Uncharacterized protein n=1 Tax=Scortum barcoo TaxID=214431 RepID=A0ACB8W3G3_9TELE|nr:hypothetical protein L3Q82_013506 [Scortum barcoo]
MQKITGFLRIVLGTQPDFAPRPGRHCEKQGYLLTQPLQCSVNTVLLRLALIGESQGLSLQPGSRDVRTDLYPSV